MFFTWFVVGLVIVLSIFYFRNGTERGREMKRRVKGAFQDDGVYYAIMVPSIMFWICIFALIWPVVIWIEFFYKKGKL